MRDNDTDSERKRCGSLLGGAGPAEDDGVSDTVAWPQVHREGTAAWPNWQQQYGEHQCLEIGKSFNNRSKIGYAGR